MTADRNLSLTVRHLFAVFVHCFHYPTVRAKHLPWFLFGMPQNTLQQTSTCKKHNNVFLGSKDFNGCKHCFDARLSARFSLQPHKHAYHAYKQIRVDIILHSLSRCIHTWAISKSLVSPKGHPQIWEGPIAYHPFVMIYGKFWGYHLQETATYNIYIYYN